MQFFLIPPSGESGRGLSVAPTVRKWFASDAAQDASSPRIGQMLGERCQPCGRRGSQFSPISLPWAPTHEWWEMQSLARPGYPVLRVVV